jgi:hypothetical protein
MGSRDGMRMRREWLGTSARLSVARQTAGRHEVVVLLAGIESSLGRAWNATESSGGWGCNELSVSSRPDRACVVGRG